MSIVKPSVNPMETAKCTDTRNIFVNYLFTPIEFVTHCWDCQGYRYGTAKDVSVLTIFLVYQFHNHLICKKQMSDNSESIIFHPYPKLSRTLRVVFKRDPK